MDQVARTCCSAARSSCSCRRRPQHIPSPTMRSAWALAMCALLLAHAAPAEASIFDSIGNALGNAAGAVGGAVSDAFGAVKDFGQGVADKAVGAWETVKGWSVDAWEKARACPARVPVCRQLLAGRGELQGSCHATHLPHARPPAPALPPSTRPPARSQTRGAFVDAKNWVECTAVDWGERAGWPGGGNCLAMPPRAWSAHPPTRPSTRSRVPSPPPSNHAGSFDIEVCLEAPPSELCTSACKANLDKLPGPCVSCWSGAACGAALRGCRCCCFRCCFRLCCRTRPPALARRLPPPPTVPQQLPCVLPRLSSLACASWLFLPSAAAGPDHRGRLRQGRPARL